MQAELRDRGKQDSAVLDAQQAEVVGLAQRGGGALQIALLLSKMRTKRCSSSFI